MPSNVTEALELLCQCIRSLIDVKLDPQDLVSAKDDIVDDQIKCKLQDTLSILSDYAVRLKGYSVNAINGKKKREANSGDRCCCECLCDGMETVTVAEVAEMSRGGKPARASSVPRITERRCAACESNELGEKRRRDPRLIKSAVGFALGTEGKRDDRRNGLPPAKVTVPRPRTPFARRAFCIDTLAPPFSVVHGCRDADYPEHWRLMSVYQQSYRNPQRRRARHF